MKGKEKNSFKMVEMSGGYVSVEDGPPAPDVAPGMNFRKNTAKEGPPNDSSFYFRLSGLNLYYTATDKDMVVLGALKINNIETIAQGDLAYLTRFCISIRDIEQDLWTICAPSDEEYKKWKCAIETVLGIACEEKKDDAEEVKVAQPIFLVSTPSPYCNEGWNYLKKGKNWQCLCEEGKQQSPINLRKYCQIPGAIKDMKNKVNSPALFQFMPVSSEDYDLVWEDNTVKLKCKEEKCTKPMAKVIDFDYSEFEARELHFKTPSEHTINGQYYPMEIQAIFWPISQQAFRDKLIVSWLVESTPGGTNQFMDKLDLLNLPSKSNTKIKISEKPVMLNLQGMFLSNEVEKFFDYFSYYYYMGSLTTPQCDEHVRWIVVSDPIPLGMSIF